MNLYEKIDLYKTAIDELHPFEGELLKLLPAIFLYSSRVWL